MTTRPLLLTLPRNAPATAGFTLFELIIVIVVLAIVSVIFLPKAFDSGALTLKAQAQTLASNLQRAQLLATSSNKNILVCANSGTYMIQIDGLSCPNELPTSPQPTQPVVVALDKNATFDANQTLIYSSSTGTPQSSVPVSFKIWSAGRTSSYTVEVAALSGLITISNP
jgi:prepilin-type N-terminal cleavage/methylation domain-containing protein